MHCSLIRDRYNGGLIRHPGTDQGRSDREVVVARLVTVRRPEEVRQQAQLYIKTYIVLPSGVVGLLCLIGGVGGLGYQLMATESYTGATFYQGTGLIILGVLTGLAQTRYHHYILNQFPDVLAARMRVAAQRRGARAKKELQTTEIEHAGRRLIPFAYMGGAAALIGSALAATVYGQVSALPAMLLPWAGFYWARLFFWRKVLQ